MIGLRQKLSVLVLVSLVGAACSSGDVIQNRISLQIKGGVLQSFDLFVDVRGSGAVFDASGAPLCIGDTLLSMRSLTTPLLRGSPVGGPSKPGYRKPSRRRPISARPNL
jgi:hypothetical protein